MKIKGGICMSQRKQKTFDALFLYSQKRIKHAKTWTTKGFRNTTA